MSEHEHSAKDEPATKPTQDEVAKKAYAIYVKEGRPQGHADQNWSDAEAQLRNAGGRQRTNAEAEDLTPSGRPSFPTTSSVRSI